MRKSQSLFQIVAANCFRIRKDISSSPFSVSYRELPRGRGVRSGIVYRICGQRCAAFPNAAAKPKRNGT